MKLMTGVTEYCFDKEKKKEKIRNLFFLALTYSNIDDYVMKVS